MTTYLYWIHYPDHSDPLSQGYIGISSDPKKRLSGHRRSPSNLMVKGALKKGAIMTILDEFTDESLALAKEEVYRPNELIGWNIVKVEGNRLLLYPQPNPGPEFLPSSRGNHSPPSTLEEEQTQEEGKNSQKPLDENYPSVLNYGILYMFLVWHVNESWTIKTIFDHTVINAE